MRRPRDTQRKKLYDAEQRAFGRPEKRAERYETLPEIHDFLRGLAPVIRCLSGEYLPIRVGDGRGRRRACALPWRREIRLPRWSRCDWVILHEVAHILQPTNTAWHGPEFCGVYLFLVREVMGADQAIKLEQAMHDGHVRWVAP